MGLADPSPPCAIDRRSTSAFAPDGMFTHALACAPVLVSGIFGPSTPSKKFQVEPLLVEYWMLIELVPAIAVWTLHTTRICVAWERSARMRLRVLVSVTAAGSEV